MSARAQYVTIPDTNFVNWLKTHGYTNCVTGNQMDTTCNKVINDTLIDCFNANIYDLTGISYFHNLKVLQCSKNHLRVAFSHRHSAEDSDPREGRVL